MKLLTVPEMTFTTVQRSLKVIEIAWVFSQRPEK